MVSGGGGCSCMLLLHPISTSADAGPDLCTLCPDLCTLHPDLWTLCLWCFPSSGANIPLAQVVVGPSYILRSWCFFIQPLAQILHLHTWWHHPLQLALVVLFHPATGANTALAPGQLALCGGGQWWLYIYIYIYIEVADYQQRWPPAMCWWTFGTASSIGAGGMKGSF